MPTPWLSWPNKLASTRWSATRRASSSELPSARQIAMAKPCSRSGLTRTSPTELCPSAICAPFPRSLCWRAQGSVLQEPCQLAPISRGESPCFGPAHGPCPEATWGHSGLVLVHRPGDGRRGGRHGREPHAGDFPLGLSLPAAARPAGVGPDAAATAVQPAGRRSEEHTSEL